MEIKITSVVNHSEFLQAFADVTEDKVTKQVSFCFKSLPITKDGVFNALMCKFNEPLVVDIPSGEPLSVEPIDVKPHVPDTVRIASVKALENIYKAMPIAARTITTEEAIDEGKVC